VPPLASNHADRLDHVFLRSVGVPHGEIKEPTGSKLAARTRLIN
jgi:hypothetical protein